MSESYVRNAQMLYCAAFLLPQVATLPVHTHLRRCGHVRGELRFSATMSLASHHEYGMHAFHALLMFLREYVHCFRLFVINNSACASTRLHPRVTLERVSSCIILSQKAHMCVWTLGWSIATASTLLIRVLTRQQICTHNRIIFHIVAIEERFHLVHK